MCTEVRGKKFCGYLRYQRQEFSRSPSHVKININFKSQVHGNVVAIVVEMSPPVQIIIILLSIRHNNHQWGHSGVFEESIFQGPGKGKGKAAVEAEEDIEMEVTKANKGPRKNRCETHCQ
jgi:hypothetical protein